MEEKEVIETATFVDSWNSHQLLKIISFTECLVKARIPFEFIDEGGGIVKYNIKAELPKWIHILNYTTNRIEEDNTYHQKILQTLCEIRNILDKKQTMYG